MTIIVHMGSVKNLEIAMLLDNRRIDYFSYAWRKSSYFPKFQRLGCKMFLEEF